MRRKLIPTRTRYLAKKAAPWAAKICRVEGGYLAFESISDFDTWRAQK